MRRPVDLRYSLSYREVQELLAERGINVDHSTILAIGTALGQEFLNPGSAALDFPESSRPRLGNPARTGRTVLGRLLRCQWPWTLLPASRHLKPSYAK